MIAAITVSLLPLCTKEPPEFFQVTDAVCLALFVADYLLRFLSADYRLGYHQWMAFVKFPFRLISLMDLLSICALASSVFGLRPGELAQVFTAVRLVRAFRYSKSVRTIVSILKQSRTPLTAVAPWRWATS